MNKQESIKALTLRSLLWSMSQNCIYLADLLDTTIRIQFVRKSIKEMQAYWVAHLVGEGYNSDVLPASFWHCTDTSRAGLNCKLHAAARELAQQGRRVAEGVVGDWSIVGTDVVSFETAHIDFRIEGTKVMSIASGRESVLYDTPAALAAAIEAGRAAPCRWVITEIEPEPESIADLLPELESAKGWEGTSCGKQTIQEIEDTAKLLRGSLACDADSKGFMLELDTEEEPSPKPLGDIPEPCGPVYLSTENNMLYRMVADKVMCRGRGCSWKLSVYPVQVFKEAVADMRVLLPWTPTEEYSHGIDIETNAYELVKAELLALPFVWEVQSAVPYWEGARYSQVVVTLTHDMPFTDFKDAVWKACPMYQVAFR